MKFTTMTLKTNLNMDYNSSEIKHINTSKTNCYNMKNRSDKYPLHVYVKDNHSARFKSKFKASITGLHMGRLEA